MIGRFSLGLTGLLLLAGPVLAHDDAGPSHKKFEAGQPGDPKQPSRTVDMTMRETEDAKMMFTPDKIEVRRGEQVRFLLKNDGKTDHEFMLDSIEHNARHKIAMEKNPDMEHDDPNGKRLAPEKTSEILWRFTKAGTFEYACLIPGHYESGMHGIVVVK
jgi:uncharacterized cupredoxin-like copper-binding protein